MNHVKVLILTGCMLLLTDCRTAPSLMIQKVDDKEHSLMKEKYMEATMVPGSEINVVSTEKFDINKGQTSYINMNEKTFMDLLNTSSDTLSPIEGIWSNEKKPYKIGIQKAEGKGRYIAFILDTEEPTMKKGDIIAEFLETRYGNTYSTEYYLDEKTKVDTKSYIDEHGMLLIFLIKWGRESVAFIKDFPDIFHK